MEAPGTYRLTVVAIALAMFALSAVMLKQLPQGFIPTEDTGSVLILTDAAIDALMGIGAYAGTAGGLVTYPDPHPYPMNANLRCDSASGEFRGPAKPDPKLYMSDLAHISAHYATPEYDVEATQPEHTFDQVARPFSRQRVRGFLEQVSLSKESAGIKDEAGNDLPGTVKTVKLDVSVVELVHTRSQVPYLNYALLRGLMGGVNSATFLGNPRGTVLYLNFDSDPVPGWDGRIVQEDLERDVRPRRDLFHLVGSRCSVPLGTELRVIEHAGEGGDGRVEEHDAGDVGWVLADVEAGCQPGDAVADQNNRQRHFCGAQRAGEPLVLRQSGVMLAVGDIRPGILPMALATKMKRPTAPTRGR